MTMEQIEAELSAAWKRWATEAGLPPESVVTLLAKLRVAYGDMGRPYHHFGHALEVTRECWRVFHQRETRGPAGDVCLPVLLLAALFHDVVYLPGSTQSEELSAELAMAQAREWNWSEEWVRGVGEAIRATRHDRLPDEHPPTARLLCDADLASLALPWEEFLRRSLAVRQEWFGWSDEVFWPGRQRFFQSMLDRGERLYGTEEIRGEMLGPARDNMLRFLREWNRLVPSQSSSL
jgi:predicted metal-dependent HD superfamily phosphohydrolase